MRRLTLISKRVDPATDQAGRVLDEDYWKQSYRGARGGNRTRTVLSDLGILSRALALS